MTRLLALTVVLVALTAAACGSDSSSNSTSPSTPTTTPDVTINILGDNGTQSYAPNPATARVGQTVAWMNTDTITHTATQDSGLFQTGNIAAGMTSTPIMMNTAGTFAYHCTIHPGMVATLTVQ